MRAERNDHGRAGRRRHYGRAGRLIEQQQHHHEGQLGPEQLLVLNDNDPQQPERLELHERHRWHVEQQRRHERLGFRRRVGIDVLQPERRRGLVLHGSWRRVEQLLVDDEVSFAAAGAERAGCTQPAFVSRLLRRG